MQVRNQFARHFVKGDDTPHPSWQTTGESVPTSQGRKIVYTERKPNMVKRPLVVNGEAQWVRHPTTGNPLWLRQEFVQDEEQPFIEREFILWDNGSGMTYKNYDFRPSEEELERKAVTEQLTPDKLLQQLSKLQNQYESLQAQLLEREQAAEALAEEAEPTL